MAEIVQGKIIGVQPGKLMVEIPYTNTERFIRRQYEELRVELQDGRHRTPEQLRKAWAIMGEMAAEAYGDKRLAEDDIYKPMRAEFSARLQDRLQDRLFHLSDADVTEAKEFINFLLDVCMEMDIPLSRPAAEMTDDIQHFVHSSAVNKRCAVCGQKADLHHVDRVGMGRDRTDICHIGMRCLPLCRKHHEEAHRHTDQEFMERYHLESVAIDEEIAKAYKLKGR